MTFFFIGPFISAIDIPWYLLEMKRQKAEASLETGYMIQIELNELFDNFTIDYSLIYTKVNIVWHISLFVTPIFPLAPTGVFFYAVVTYWISKHRFLRRSNQPFKAGSSIFFYCFNNIKNGIHTLLFGYVIFNVLIFTNRREWDEIKDYDLQGNELMYTVIGGFWVLFILFDFLYVRYLFCLPCRNNNKNSRNINYQGQPSYKEAKLSDNFAMFNPMPTPSPIENSQTEADKANGNNKQKYQENNNNAHVEHYQA